MKNYIEAVNFNKYRFILSNLAYKNILKLAMNNLCSINHYYVLNRNLTSLNIEKKIRSNIVVKKVDSDDLNHIIKTLKLLKPNDRKEVVSRLLFYKAGFENCYVAKTKKDEVAYIQWLIYPSENLIIKEHFRRKFYPLRENQVMIENAFTLDRKSTRLNSSHIPLSRMPSSA